LLCVSILGYNMEQDVNRLLDALAALIPGSVCVIYLHLPLEGLEEMTMSGALPDMVISSKVFPGFLKGRSSRRAGAPARTGKTGV
jgi:hypothetical protein